ncbi:formimidoylglutamase [Winogradskyella sp. UBA3174]|uniref:formimidoylglutamase n=1 Tax=Winogradskyella sp. UBA3174 TaxID=1947785 RepID=UPI0025E30CD4|nr:formimidoylglutamase [Winogradskyella sp. UBA3174]|tara:strand:+ start:21107 stop:22273 length:1167 start_codon:yes stop_codon:yes gene_type:complete
MNFNFLTPVSDSVLAHNELIALQALGKKIKVHSRQNGIPDLENVQLAIIGVQENRNDVNYIGANINFDSIRKTLYTLFPGNWHTTIADLGDIEPGETVEDTYFAIRTAITVLVELNIIPIILGGSQDLTFANYRAYDTILPMVNIVNVDTNFDLGDANLPIRNNSYVGKVIVEEPYNLFNYSTIGYQTYFNSQEEIDLIEKLYFEGYRLGEVSANINMVEPLMRDAHIVSIDLKSVQASEVSDNQKYSPNGFSGKEICAISRYAGISNKVSSFGIYEYSNSKNDNATSMLLAQMIWYFVEGVNCRVKDDDFTNDKYFQKYNVLVGEDELIFYKSLKTGRWWIEIPFLPDVNNKLKKHTLLPCMHSDYLQATQGEIPERWYKAYRKNSF